MILDDINKPFGPINRCSKNFVNVSAMTSPPFAFSGIMYIWYSFITNYKEMLVQLNYGRNVRVMCSVQCAVCNVQYACVQCCAMCMCVVLCSVRTRISGRVTPISGKNSWNQCKREIILNIVKFRY